VAAVGTGMASVVWGSIVFFTLDQGNINPEELFLIIFGGFGGKNKKKTDLCRVKL
jgi:hypothetical protein